MLNAKFRRNYQNPETFSSLVSDKGDVRFVAFPYNFFIHEV